ncbi:hypothetical protein DPMN_067043 [Dreissena polymorpha]|uniref:Uncharacterized protein n=1 Tax=Dreissena polymorpha TaxID=45954 RepID=A0A9D3YUK9_DREPO|nr:hypothetical protein DPMN_067043 [Dreissena polymorpha]
MASMYRSTLQISDIFIDVVTSVTSIETDIRDYMILRDSDRLFYFIQCDYNAAEHLVLSTVMSYSKYIDS